MMSSVVCEIAKGMTPTPRSTTARDGTVFSIEKRIQWRAFAECGFDALRWVGAMRTQLGTTDVRGVMVARTGGLRIGARRVPAQRAAHVDCAFLARGNDGSSTIGRFTARVGVVVQLCRNGAAYCTAVELWPLRQLETPERNVLRAHDDELPYVLYLSTLATQQPRCAVSSDRPLRAVLTICA
jgi:hypothetical protein